MYGRAVGITNEHYRFFQRRGGDGQAQPPPPPPPPPASRTIRFNDEADQMSSRTFEIWLRNQHEEASRPVGKDFVVEALVRRRSSWACIRGASEGFEFSSVPPELRSIRQVSSGRQEVDKTQPRRRLRREAANDTRGRSPARRVVSAVTAGTKNIAIFPRKFLSDVDVGTKKIVERMTTRRSVETPLPPYTGCDKKIQGVS
jgi:hypothetical protein